MSVLIALGVAVALTIVAAVYLYKRSTKLSIVGLSVGRNGEIHVRVNLGANYQSFDGKRLVLSTQSLGKVYTSICSAMQTNGASPTPAQFSLVEMVTPAGAATLVGTSFPIDLPVGNNDYAIITPMW